ncbi:hypothetical protein ACH4VX_24530 [Streptomyces sp. NPDC020731]|uniref:hypothetical protein n=1 Tax=Streptomyces sp. NPDC020731 TaxID=3365085 RepID=UPI00379BCB50
MLDDLGLHDTAFTTRTIADQAEAERLGFTGSPTILVDGQDPFTEPDHAAGLTCRVYRIPDGLAGLPATDQLRQVLANAS